MLIQFVLLIILAAVFITTWKRAKQTVISWREAMLWSVLWIVAALVILLPDSTSVVARLFGVGRGVDIVIYASITLLFVLVFKAFLTLDRLERSLTDVVRKEALRELPKEEKHG